MWVCVYRLEWPSERCWTDAQHKGIMMTLAFILALLVMQLHTVFDTKTSILLIPPWSMPSLHTDLLCSCIFGFSHKLSSCAGRPADVWEQQRAQMNRSQNSVLLNSALSETSQMISLHNKSDAFFHLLAKLMVIYVQVIHKVVDQYQWLKNYWICGWDLWLSWRASCLPARFSVLIGDENDVLKRAFGPFLLLVKCFRKQKQ